ncbi:glycosyltransferase [Halalkalibacter wakoensis JCM 9140]|uniref:Glycosyltransferase n=1 Tax=Halalkalibacter wakoensis JCM 9140 TaxID=1236970 RepID=W4Q7Y4_9BACI|nr:glycosyltransferase [Halalkalibacter wakoensis]GAE28186.1 glycosyltransferase [Halalkalibacter wakoensis JCM 9140]
MLEKDYSVLMSVYHKENPTYFRTSIESMINQTLPPNQIVIVKDGKLTDELNEVIKEYELFYPNMFTIVPLNNNVGLGSALNEGLKQCRNELVARMDADDISVRERCELQVQEFINNSNLSIVGAIIDEFYEDPNDIVSSRVVPTSHKDILKFSRRRNPFNHPTVMYKKSEVLCCGGYGKYRRNQDLDLFVRMLNSGYIAANIGKALVLFRANEDNLKRRKSWEKCKSYISMIYNFWKLGYSSLFDLIVVTTSQIIVFLAPLWFLEWLSNTFLRKTHIK